MSNESCIERSIKLIKLKADDNEASIETVDRGLKLLKMDKHKELKFDNEGLSVCFLYRGCIEFKTPREKGILQRDQPIVILSGNTISLKARSLTDVEQGEKSCVAAMLSLDMEILYNLRSNLLACGYSVKKMQRQSKPIDADKIGQLISKLISKADDRLYRSILYPLVLTEIHFHVVMSSHFKGLINQLITPKQHHKIEQAIALIKQNVAQKLNVKNLATRVGMSPSSFHAHFKEVTGKTPLQLHKQLKLGQARDILRAKQIPISSAAYMVGYESLSQFSRDYHRQFGILPSAERSLRHKPKV